jgi:hypothetical protein
MVPQLEAAGLRFVGRDETGQRMEVRYQLEAGKDSCKRIADSRSCNMPLSYI